jgi:hypothetical protein
MFDVGTAQIDGRSVEQLQKIVDAADESLPTQSRQHADRVAFAATHIGILSINDRITHVYFNFVGAGRDVQNLRMIVSRRRLSGLQTIYEDHRIRRRAGHDDLGWIRHRHFPRTEPAAGR